MFASFRTIIERDTYDSILYAVSGGLIILSAYHLAMFFQNRDKSYLLYSSYTFFSLLAYLPMVETGFLKDLNDLFGFDAASKKFFTIVYNCIYFFFFTQFLSVKNTNKTWYRVITMPVLVMLIAAIFSFLLLRVSNIEFFFSGFNKVFIFAIAIQTIISFYILIRLKSKLKYYILVGGVVLFICSVIGERFVRELPWINISRKMGDFIFFMGFFVENLTFSFALGHWQRNNFLEKSSFHQNFIAEMKKNDVLKDSMNLENQKRLLIENEKMRYLQEISDLNLSVLQSQMNPHFIFNALNSIKFYILQNEPEIAAGYLTKFSKIIRTILVATSTKEFTLEQELHTLQIYMDIENLRFNNSIAFTINVAPEIDSQKIKLPPMVLQPFIENAILHGVSSVEDKKIKLEIFLNSHGVEIQIIDNGIGRSKAGNAKSKNKSRPSMGTNIANGMLKNYFGADAYLITYHDLHEDDKPLGTMVVLQIPVPEKSLR